MSWWLILIIVAVVILLVVWIISLYNRLVRLRVEVQQGWANIDVQLRRRYDLTTMRPFLRAPRPRRRRVCSLTVLPA